MGAWGHEIWSNDKAMDIEGDFHDELKKYDTKADAMSALTDAYIEGEVEDAETDVVLAIADLQIEYKVPYGDVIAEAKRICEEKREANDWQVPEERARILDEFLQKIQTYSKGNAI